MPVLTYLWIIPLLPLVGAAVNGIFGGRWSKSAISTVALSSTTLAFLAALEAVREFFSLPADQIPFIKSFFTWISAGGFRADFALQVDQLTVIMLLVVTGVGWLIHIYSSGYMHDDPGYRRFFSYLNAIHVSSCWCLILAGQLLADVRRLGGCRPMQLPADRIFLLETIRHQCREQSVLGEPHRRFWFSPGRAAHLPHV